MGYGLECRTEQGSHVLLDLVSVLNDINGDIRGAENPGAVQLSAV